MPSPDSSNFPGGVIKALLDYDGEMLAYREKQETRIKALIEPLKLFMKVHGMIPGCKIDPDTMVDTLTEAFNKAEEAIAKVESS